MLTDSLVAINLVKENILLNKKSVPLLFYWNGESTIEDKLKIDSEFISYIKDVIKNLTDFIYCNVSYFYFTINDNGEEQYTEHECSVQDLIKLSDFNEKIITDYLVKCFKKLFVSGLKYEYNSILTNNDEIIKDIYNLLQQKFKSRISKKTVINWIRSLFNDKNIHEENLNCIIDKLEKILKDVE